MDIISIILIITVVIYLITIILVSVMCTRMVSKGEFLSYTSEHRKEHSKHWAEHDKITDNMEVLLHNIKSSQQDIGFKIDKVTVTMNTVEQSLRAERERLYPAFLEIDKEVDLLKVDISRLLGINSVKEK